MATGFARRPPPRRTRFSWAPVISELRRRSSGERPASISRHPHQKTETAAIPLSATPTTCLARKWAWASAMTRPDEHFRRRSRRRLLEYHGPQLALQCGDRVQRKQLWLDQKL